jgi:2-dehydropantoate 2-reductase
MARRYVIYGAGGVGGVIGGRLFHHGHDAALICRGAHLEAIRARGLTLKSPAGTLQIPIPAVGHPSELRFTADDVVILTMKTQDSIGALDDLRAAAGPDVAVVCAQNGIENERLALRRFARVYGLVVRFPASFTQPGEILNYDVNGTGGMEMGRFPEGRDALIDGVAADLASCGFWTAVEDKITRWKYNKLIRNMGAAFAAVFGPEADTAALRAKLEAEAIAVYTKAGIDFATQQEEAALGRAPGFTWGTIPGYPPFASSVWQGLQRGVHTVETDYVNGEIALLGSLHGVPTPYNRALQEFATRAVREGIAPGTASVADVMQASERMTVPA